MNSLHQVTSNAQFVNNDILLLRKVGCLFCHTEILTFTCHSFRHANLTLGDTIMG